MSEQSYSGPARYDVEIVYADGTEEKVRWIPLSQVLIMVNAMIDGDDIVIHHVGYTEPNVLYS